MPEILSFCPSYPFKCPKCGSHKIEEIMVDMTVSSEVAEISPEGGEITYGEQTNEGGHVDRYGCGQCGYTIIDHDSPFCEDGLDGEALASALKALAEGRPQ